jgi:hypothetical protein
MNVINKILGIRKDKHSKNLNEVSSSMGGSALHTYEGIEGKFTSEYEAKQHQKRELRKKKFYEGV